jgi:hypothetical protein
VKHGAASARHPGAGGRDSYSRSMGGTGAGTAIMLAVAALLWFLYLVPTWVRRREFIASEHGAGRPERLIRAEQRRADAAAARASRAAQRAAPASAPRPALDPGVLRRRRMRRTRFGASVLMVAATVVACVQGWLVATTGMTLGAFFVLVAAITGGGAAIATQRRLDALAMPRAAVPVRARTAVQLPAATPAPRRAASWTPVETPRPMYLSRPAPEPLAPSPGLQEALRAAAAEAEATLRAAQNAPEVAPLRSTRPSKYAGMGVLGPDAVEATDLDEVLRRRRSAG